MHTGRPFSLASSGNSSADEGLPLFQQNKKSRFSLIESARCGALWDNRESDGPVRRKTDDGAIAQTSLQNLPAGPMRPFALVQHDVLASSRRLSMPGTATGFTFPNVAPMAMTVSGGSAAAGRATSRLAPSASAPLDAAIAAAAFHHRTVTGACSPHVFSSHAFSISRATTPAHSVMPTPRSSINGSLYGTPSEQAAALDAAADRGLRASLSRRSLSGTEQVLDTPVWVSRLRLLGRLLLAALFSNMLWQELREWRAVTGYGWGELGGPRRGRADDLPPLATLLSGAALVLLVGGWGSSLAAAFLAARLLVQCGEAWEEMLAVLQERSSNLLPAKELAVVGTVVAYLGHTVCLAEWLPGHGRLGGWAGAWWGGGGTTTAAKGKATGLLYTQQWRPGQPLILAVGRLLVAPLFISIAALQYYDMVRGNAGLARWKARLLHPTYWLPPGDASANNWTAAQALVALLPALGAADNRVTALLAALLVAEALACWRFWSVVWISKHYVAYLRRHFTANLAIAGGLLLSLPEGTHARAVLRELKKT